MTRRLKKSLWPHCVTIGSDRHPDIDPIELWLAENFGAWRGRWNTVYRHNATDFYFRDQGSAVMFALKWS